MSDPEEPDWRKVVLKEIGDTREFAISRAEKARNEALAVFSGFALLLSILGYLGLLHVVGRKLEEVGADTILRSAREAEAATVTYSLTASNLVNQLSIILKEVTNSLPPRIEYGRMEARGSTDYTATFAPFKEPPIVVLGCEFRQFGEQREAFVTMGKPATITNFSARLVHGDGSWTAHGGVIHWIAIGR